jgi:hypothetical protein
LIDSRNESVYSHHYSRYEEAFKNAADVNIQNTNRNYQLFIFSPSKEVAVRIFALLAGLVHAELQMN